MFEAVKVFDEGPPLINMKFEDQIKRREYLIQSFLDKKLTGEEEREFNSLSLKDPSVLAEIKEYRDIEMGLRAIETENISKQINRWERKYTVDHQFSSRRLLAYAASVAALIIIVSVVYVQFFEQTPESLYSEYYQPYEDLILDRASGSFNNLELAMESYDKGRFDLAEPLLQRHFSMNPQDSLALLYLGITQLELNRYEEAEGNFRLLMTNVKYIQQAQWYLSMLYLKTNKVRLAQQMFGQILQYPDHYKLKQAEQILEELD